jgi:hypothetical protein
MTEFQGHHANSGGREKEEERGEGRESHDRRFNALSRASQAHSSVNSRDTIPIRPTTNQVASPIQEQPW